MPPKARSIHEAARIALTVTMTVEEAQGLVAVAEDHGSEYPINDAAERACQRLQAAISARVVSDHTHIFVSSNPAEPCDYCGKTEAQLLDELRGRLGWIGEEG